MVIACLLTAAFQAVAATPIDVTYRGRTITGLADGEPVRTGSGSDEEILFKFTENGTLNLPAEALADILVVGGGGGGGGSYYYSFHSIITLRYTAGEGEGDAVEVALKWGEEHTVRDCAFARAGFAFDGWAGPETARYWPGEVVSNLTATADGTVVFAAMWDELGLPPPGEPERVERVVLRVGESVTFGNGSRLNPRYWLLGSDRRFQFASAALDVADGPYGKAVGYARRSESATNEVTVTLTGVRPGVQKVYLGRQYKVKEPKCAVRYEIEVVK